MVAEMSFVIVNVIDCEPMPYNQELTYSSDIGVLKFMVLMKLSTGGVIIDNVTVLDPVARVMFGMNAEEYNALSCESQHSQYVSNVEGKRWKIRMRFDGYKTITVSEIDTGFLG